ncbi:glycosyltransferase family 39 protein [Candidatus Daviesbacteria bacterium]|nr:glycosyltransferase family 39 protein [Candidatus Daviesbacteria bacterium]
MKKNSYFLGLILLFAFFSRLLFLNQHSIWFDEAFSYFVAKQDLVNLIYASLADNHPPLYFLILHFWIKIFGNSELILRFLSVIFNLLSIIVLYHLVKLLFGSKKAVLASIIFVLSPLILYYSVEIRMYSLFVLFSLMALFFWLRFLNSSHKKDLILFILSFPLIFLGKAFRHKKYILALSIPFLFTTPLFYYYFKVPHPLIASQNPFLGVLYTFSSFFDGGTGIVSLYTILKVGPLIIKLLLLGSLVYFFTLLLRGVVETKKTKNGRFILILIISPILFMFFLGLILPVFSARGFIFLAPFVFIILSLGIPNLKVFLLTCFIFILLDLNYLFFPLFKGPDIEQAYLSYNFNQPLLHSSILSYYPFKYFQETKRSSKIIQNYLLINPLNKTTAYITQGNTINLPLSFDKFVFLEIKNGADMQVVNSFLLNALNEYKQENVTRNADFSYTFFIKN